MKKIVGIIKPFIMKQQLYVYEDGEQIEAVAPTLEELDSAVLMLSNRYEINQVDLSGPKSFLSKVSKDIKKAEMQKYNKNELKINII